MPTELLTENRREATVVPMPHRVAEAARRRLDARGRTITTALVWALQEALAGLEVGDQVELETDPFSAIVRSLKVSTEARPWSERVEERSSR